MRSLLVMGIPYQHAPEVSIVRTDTCSAQQVIRQTCLSSRFGMIGQRLPTADEPVRFITAGFTPPGFGCKGLFSRVFGLPPQRLAPLSQARAHGWAL
jgi:hypothetical protein